MPPPLTLWSGVVIGHDNRFVFAVRQRDYCALPVPALPMPDRFLLFLAAPRAIDRAVREGAVAFFTSVHFITLPMKLYLFLQTYGGLALSLAGHRCLLFAKGQEAIVLLR